MIGESVHTTSKHVVESGSDVLTEIHSCRGLGDAAPRAKKQFVKEVRMAVMHPHPQWVVEDTLAERGEGPVLVGHEAGHRIHIAREDMLSVAKDRYGVIRVFEVPEDVRQFQGLGE